MARTQKWQFGLALLLGIGGASIFWLYGPYLEREVSRRLNEEVRNKPLAVEVGGSGPSALKDLPSAAAGRRYQLVSDGKQTFLADLQEGRVWRYYHHSREGGYLKEEEGFLPLPFYWGGKKVFSAGEVEPVSQKGGQPANPAPDK